MEDWSWGLALTAATIMIHASGIALVGMAAHHVRESLLARHRRRHALTMIVGVIGLFGLLLAALHGFEAAAWALAFWWLDALPSYGEALLYSVDSMTTRGASGLTLAPEWRLMGALEAAAGMLLFGISTAFVFSLMQYFAPLIYRDPPSGQ